MFLFSQQLLPHLLHELRGPQRQQPIRDRLALARLVVRQEHHFRTHLGRRWGNHEICWFLWDVFRRFFWRFIGFYVDFMMTCLLLKGDLRRFRRILGLNGVFSPPRRWGLLDFITAVLLLLLLFLLLANPLRQLPRQSSSPSFSPILFASFWRSGHCWTSTASFGSQWASLDLNRQRIIPVGIPGPQPPASYPSGHPWTSTASFRSQWAPLDLNDQILSPNISQSIITTHHHKASSQIVITDHFHKASSQYIITKYDHKTLSQNIMTKHHHKA